MENRPENLNVGDVGQSANKYASVAGRHPHYIVRRVDACLSDACNDSDWWRIPDPPKGLLHKLLDTLKRKRAGR